MPKFIPIVLMAILVLTLLRTLDQALEAGTLSEEEYSKARQRIVEEYFPEMMETPNRP